MTNSAHKRQVGQNLRLAIEAIGMRPADLSRTFGVSPSKLGNWLRGDNYPEPPLLVRLCDEYGLTMDWFYRGTRAGVAASVAASLRSAEAASAAAQMAEAGPEA